MSDVELPEISATLSPHAVQLDTKVVRPRSPRELLSGILAAGDAISGLVAALAALVVGDLVGLHVDGPLFVAMCLLLHIGASSLLGVYWTRHSSMERFRLRLMVLSLFVLTSFLLWGRDGSFAELVCCTARKLCNCAAAGGRRSARLSARVTAL